jgi:hypothetical protein
LLAQNNEASALAIEMEKTHAGLVISEATAQTPQKRVKRVEEIRNSIFYVVKFELDDTAIYAVKKVSSSWRTKKSKGIISVIYTDQTLTLDESPAFEISKTIDFFIVGDKVLIINKENFESALSYKQAHEEAFAVLQEEPEFSAIFSDLTPIRDFVGNNKIQLRRALAIGDRGHYKTLAFMSNLRTHSEKYRLAIIFDESGRIVPTADTCRAIFQALLDHRLLSPFSQNIYDVPDAVTVAS